MAILFHLRPAGPRPVFCLMLAFAWGDMVDCDTDGNAKNLADREWTGLYAEIRFRPGEVFDVTVACEDPLVLEVKPPAECLAAAVAQLLAIASAGGYGPIRTGLSPW